MLALDGAAADEFHRVKLGYPEFGGSPYLKAALTRLYDGISADDLQIYAGGGSPWHRLLNAFDEDESGTIAIWELGIYLEEEKGGELRFDLDRCDDGAPGDTFASLDRAVGVPEGQPAPDFTLPMVHGTETVTLSDHFGDTPVALIFGSYT